MPSPFRKCLWQAGAGVPALSSGRWEMLQWGSPHGAMTRTQNSRAMSPSNLSLLQKSLLERIKVTLCCYFQTHTSWWLLPLYSPTLFIYLFLLLNHRPGKYYLGHQNPRLGLLMYFAACFPVFCGTRQLKMDHERPAVLPWWSFPAAGASLLFILKLMEPLKTERCLCRGCFRSGCSHGAMASAEQLCRCHCFIAV